MSLSNDIKQRSNRGDNPQGSGNLDPILSERPRERRASRRKGMVSSAKWCRD